MTFTVLACAHIHTPSEQGGKLALLTPGSQFFHTGSSRRASHPHRRPLGDDRLSLGKLADSYTLLFFSSIIDLFHTGH